MSLKPYPLRFFEERRLPKNYSGPVFLWDIDKTYLDTHFSSLRGLFKIPVEFAVDKKAIPGMPEILRGLRRGPGKKVACHPIYFVSASPPFLKKVLEHKMLLDGVEHDGILFKDWFQTLWELKPGRLREQLGFKLTAHLSLRQHWPLATEYLFGDDTEQDALAFSLYADILAGKIKTKALEKNMIQHGVSWEDRNRIHELAESLPNQRGQVGKIFIHLAHKTPLARFKKFGSRLIPVRNSEELAVVLRELNLVS